MLRRLGYKFVLSTLLAFAVLALPGSSHAKFLVVYTFKGGSDGSGPDAGLISDNAGKLYGTQVAGGSIPSAKKAGAATAAHQLPV